MGRETEIFGKSYCTHDFDASHDPKCMSLIIKHGVEAYGRFWLLIECMGRSSTGVIDLGIEGQREMLERELWLQHGELDTYLGTLARLDLINADALERGHVASLAFLNRQEWLASKSAAGRKGNEKRWGSQPETAA